MLRLTAKSYPRCRRHHQWGSHAKNGHTVFSGVWSGRLQKEDLNQIDACVSLLPWKGLFRPALVISLAKTCGENGNKEAAEKEERIQCTPLCWIHPLPQSRCPIPPPPHSFSALPHLLPHHLTFLGRWLGTHWHGKAPAAGAPFLQLYSNQHWQRIRSIATRPS